MQIEKLEKANGEFSYQVSVESIDEQGKMVRHTKTFPTKHEAQAYSVRVSAALLGASSENTNQIRTVDDIYKEWLAIDSIRFAANSKVSYTYHYERFIRPSLGSLDIRQVKYPVLQSLFNTFSDNSQSTMDLIRSCLKNILDYAQKAGYINSHQLSLIYVHSDKKTTRRQMYLEEENFLGLCDHFKDEPTVIAYLYLGYYLGLRRAEALALCFSDIDFEHNTVSISRQMDFTGGKKSQFKTTSPKTDSSTAVLPLCEVLKTFLLEYQKVHPYNLIVSDPKGSFMAPTTIQHKISVVVKELGMDFHYHMLRHTFVTNLIRSGVQPKIAAKLARHSNVKTTLNVYTEVSESELHQAVDQAFSKKASNSVPQS
ncbi:site-specific integrase [Allobaculum sp. JKK-2023]|uniref:tyrosine-type recombinase/integrase n=1 Tax=Allobaculum sp. JKK-2023 TaxID=3108943 RepID=UPI002B0548F8|nr:site-specific integrase [Allobaculum sp. JKK-2023]